MQWLKDKPQHSLYSSPCSNSLRLLTLLIPIKADCVCGIATNCSGLGSQAFSRPCWYFPDTPLDKACLPERGTPGWGLKDNSQSQPFTKLNVSLLASSKANLLTPGCGEGKYSIYLQGAKQGEWAAHARKTWTPPWLSGKRFF